VRTNVATAKSILASEKDLTIEERQYLNEIVEQGERFLEMTREDSSVTRLRDRRAANETR
jgi:HD-GYP domain-containing protein (c-di-GMP phosphodiesterase class II)